MGSKNCFWYINVYIYISTLDYEYDVNKAAELAHLHTVLVWILVIDIKLKITLA